jgi:glycerol-3-phosphate cytidylyltransferase
MKLYTGGTFDLFHWGHENFLKKCSMISDEVIVSINTDKFVFDYKLEYPRMKYKERENALYNCKYVDKVVQNIGGSDSKPAILNENPDIIAVGTDWVGKNYYKQMGFTEDWLEQNGIVLLYIPYTEHISSSYIKQRMDN